MHSAKSFQKVIQFVVLALLISGWRLETAHAATPLDVAVPSLKLVPADASFCSVWLRNREQFDAVMNSKAWTELQAIPFVQLGLAMANAPDSRLQKFLGDPANRELTELVKSMVADEVFVFGATGSETMLDVMLELYAANQVTKWSAMNEPREERFLAQATAIVETLIECREDIAVPRIVFGFRTANQNAAKSQLKRLEQLAGMLPQVSPQFKGRTTRVKLGNGDYLTLQLDGGQIPWEWLRRLDVDVNVDEVDKLIEHLQALKLAISVGLAGNYVIISIADSTEYLSTFGTGESLASRSEMARLAPHSDRQLTAVHYASKELMSYVEFGQRDVGDLTDTVRSFVEEFGFDDDMRSRILDDVEEFVQDIQPYIGDHGANVECEFITPRGLESFAYSWSQYPLADSSQPLGLLEHIGGAPLMAFVSRSKQSLEQYRTTVKWIEKASVYLKEFAVEYLDDDTKSQLTKTLDELRPLMERLDSAMADKFIPAKADGQVAFVLDAKSTSKRWFEQLPPTRSALPMVELAVVYGVADAPLLEQAMAEFRAIINEAIPIIAELGDGRIDPEASFPAPEVKPVDGGKVFFYKLPDHFGIDKQVIPNAGLSKSVAVLSLIPKHTLRLMTKTPVSVAGPFAATKRPLGSAAYINIAGLIDAVSPWIDVAVAAAQSQRADALLRNRAVAVQVEAEDAGDLEELDPNVQQILDQVHALLKVLKVFSTYSSATHEEKGVWVTHGELHLSDTK